jgi:mannose/fructose/N-acetylgalactosamine-specific phosphotransferase system component IIC
VIEFSPHVIIPLLIWGSLVGLDLVSVPQAMISRPLVAGTVAGWLAGDLEAGLRMGVLFELFALDVLPVGAVRYPDYGPATVVAAALAAGTPWAGWLEPSNRAPLECTRHSAESSGTVCRGE